MARRTTRRPFVATAGCLLALGALAGCGTDRADDAGAATPPGGSMPTVYGTPRAPGTATPTSQPPQPGTTSDTGPTSGPYVEPGAGDGAPHYRENHAFQSTTEVTAAQRRRANAAIGRIDPALDDLRKNGRPTAAEVRATLLKLGYRAADVTTTDTGGLTGYTVELDRVVCVDGTIGDTGAASEVHGVYIEGTGCVKPQGGH